MKSLLLSFSLLCLLSVAVLGQTEGMTTFEKANASYQSGKYKEAIEAYEGILQQGQQSAELYFNLGNSYYKNKQLGKAILFYERAAILDSGDEDIRYNLQLAEKQIKDEFTQIPSFFLARWWGSCHRLLGSTAWSVLLIVCFWLSIAGMIYWLLAQERSQKKRGFLLGVGGLLLSALFFFLARSQRSFEMANPYAIIQERETVLRSGPDAASTELLPLHEGTKVKLLDELGNWYKVRLPDGDQGWLEDAVLERI